MKPYEYKAFDIESRRKKELNKELYDEYFKRLNSFYSNYLKKFNTQLNVTQKEIIEQIIIITSKPSNKENISFLSLLIDSYDTVGVNYLIRHPNPTIESYKLNEDASKTLLKEGVREVYAFWLYLREIVEINNNVNLEIYYTYKKRTKIFAKAIEYFVNKSPNIKIKVIEQKEELYFQSVKEMVEMFPGLKEKINPMSRKSLEIIRSYFRPWVEKSKSSAQHGEEIANMLESTKKNTIKLFFTHENTMASYLHHVKRYSVEESFIKESGFVKVSEDLFFVQG